MKSIGTNEAAISVDAAAKILGVGRSQVYRTVRDGLLRRVSGLNCTLLLSADEVQALADSRVQNITVPQLHKALIAEQSTRAGLERRLARLERTLLLRTPAFQHNEAEITELMDRVHNTLKEPPSDVLEIVDWCAVFFSVHEETLHLIEVYTDDPEPWSALLSLAEKMYKYCAGHRDDRDIKEAYTELSLARRSLRQAAFLYIRQSRGEAAAKNAIAEADTDLIRTINQHVR
jgi:hypothetical protein